MAKIGYNKGLDDLNLKDSDATPYINSRRFKYAILEKIDDIMFEKLGNVDINTLYLWEKGRLFGDNAELKWQKRHGKFHVVIITEEDHLPECVDIYSDSLESVNDVPRSIYLWGEKDTRQGITVPQWYEAIIPIIIKYPVDNPRASKKRVKIKIQEYKLNEKDGSDSFLHRFVDLMEV